MKTYIVILFLTLNACTMFKYNDFEELDKHKGSENYEMIEVFDNKFEIRDDILVDKQNKNIVAYGFKEQKLEDKNLHHLKKITNFGNEISEIENYYSLLKDGTISAADYYKNWVINGDTTKHKYIDPFSNQEIDDPYKFKAKETDPEKWLAKFKELYAKAHYIYIYISMYHFRIDDKWYWMEATLEGLPDNLKKLYPPKEDQDIRMAALPDITPDFYGKTTLGEDAFMRIVGYEEEDHESGSGLNPISFSAGNFYIELYMPLGDVIKIKRFGSMGTNIQTYKIPPQYGGRNDVVFIVQEPNEMNPGQEHGGMYVIRPKDPEQPQFRYKSISYLRNADGYPIIDKEKSVETEEYKAWVKKKRH